MNLKILISFHGLFRIEELIRKGLLGLSGKFSKLNKICKFDVRCTIIVCYNLIEKDTSTFPTSMLFLAYDVHAIEFI